MPNVQHTSAPTTRRTLAISLDDLNIGARRLSRSDWDPARDDLEEEAQSAVCRPDPSLVQAGT